MCLQRSGPSLASRGGGGRLDAHTCLALRSLASRASRRLSTPAVVWREPYRLLAAPVEPTFSGSITSMPPGTAQRQPHYVPDKDCRGNLQGGTTIEGRSGVHFILKAKEANSNAETRGLEQRLTE